MGKGKKQKKKKNNSNSTSSNRIQKINREDATKTTTKKELECKLLKVVEQLIES